MIKISIIIPVYNAEKYLRQCLDSVLNQSLKEIEVICVDDGSTDNSLNILQEYAETDNRVKVIHQQNQHAGVARNRGIDEAKGEYLHFLDADDYVLDYAYETLYNKASANKLDCLKFRSIAMTTQGNETVDFGGYMLTNQNSLDFDHLLPNWEKSPIYRLPVVAWNGLYLRSFIQEHKIRFNSMICDNDKSFFFRVVTNANRIMISRDRLVVHRILNENSLVGKRADYFDCDLQSTLIVSGQLIEDKIRPEISRVIMEREFGNCLVWAGQFLSDPEINKKILNALQTFLKNYDGLYPELFKDMYEKYINTGEFPVSQLSSHLKIFHGESLHPLVSVIIPVYNAQDNLYQCLDSLSDQTLEDIEIICVDDGSTDDSKLVLKEYAFVDKRIQILEQDHSYAGVARNYGFEKAHGEYVIFLDADDFFDPQLLEKTYNQAVNVGGADVVLFGGKKYDTRKDKFLSAYYYFKRNLLPDKEVFSRSDVPDYFLLLTTPAPWTKLFRRVFILKEGLKFQSLPNSNDVYFVLTALCLADKLTYIDEDLVYYRIGENKNIQSQKDKNPTCFLEAYEAVYKELSKRNIYNEVEKSFTAVVLSGCVYNLDTVEGSDNRITIYRRLLDPSFTEMGLLEHEPEYYYNNNDAEKVRAAKQVIEWHDKLSQKEDPCFDLLINRQDENRQPKVSVIIPVYNTEWYLKECLDSIINQTLEDIEIISIDDGSTDSSQNILLEYASSDQRISVYSQKNSGQSAARNRGAELAKGKYLYFMDSDDVLDITALECLYKKAEEDSLDVICFNADTFVDYTEPIKNLKNYNYMRTFNYLNEGEVYSGKEVFANMMNAGEYKASVPLQFLNRDFYLSHKLRFYEGIIHEDELFTFQCMLEAERVSCIPTAFYHRRLRENSTVTSEVSFANVYGDFICYIEMVRYCRDNELEGFCKDMAVMHTKTRLKVTREKYLQLSVEEKQIVAALPSMQQELFNALITDWCDEKDNETSLRDHWEKSKAQITSGKIREDELREEIKQKNKEINELTSRKEICAGSNAPLQFASSFIQFKYDLSIWEEKIIDGKLYLRVKPGMSRKGRFAIIPFCESLDKNREYYFDIKFRIKTAAKEIKFSIKEGGNSAHQIIDSYQIEENKMEKWIAVNSRFTPDSDSFSEFAFEACDLCGEDNYICLDYISIRTGKNKSFKPGFFKKSKVQ